MGFCERIVDRAKCIADERGVYPGNLNTWSPEQIVDNALRANWGYKTRRQRSTLGVTVLAMIAIQSEDQMEKFHQRLIKWQEHHGLVNDDSQKITQPGQTILLDTPKPTA